MTRVCPVAVTPARLALSYLDLQGRQPCFPDHTTPRASQPLTSPAGPPLFLPQPGALIPFYPSTRRPPPPTARFPSKFRPSESLLSQKLHGNQIHHETPSPRCLSNPNDTERPRGLIFITPVATFPPHFFFRRAQLGKRTVSLTESQPADATPRAQKAKVGDVYE